MAPVSWSPSPDWSTGVLGPTQVSPARWDECRWPQRPRGVPQDGFGVIGIRHAHCSLAAQPAEPVKHCDTGLPQ